MNAKFHNLCPDVEYDIYSGHDGNIRTLSLPGDLAMKMVWGYGDEAWIARTHERRCGVASDIAE